MLRLNIDDEFYNLIPKTNAADKVTLELNLKLHGCVEPILIWESTIIDGHARYEICNRLGISYSVRQLYFENRELALIFLCERSLSRPNITQQTQRYLIGKMFHAHRNILISGLGTGKYNTCKDIAARIEEKHGTSYCMQYQCWRYCRAVEIIRRSSPELAMEILSGRFKISIAHTILLAECEKNVLVKLAHRLRDTPDISYCYGVTKNEIITGMEKREKKKHTELAAIKHMPKFDRDAEAVRLTLTVPSWISSLGRCGDFSDVTAQARQNLACTLKNLQDAAGEMLSKLTEGN